MNQQQTNNTLWYSLGLAALLCIAFLVGITGTALARYRSEQRVPATFQVRVPARIYLGTMETRVLEEGTEDTEPVTQEVFAPNTKPGWAKAEGGLQQLRMVIANGTSDTDFSEKGQHVRLRLFGSLGMWTGSEAVNITVHVNGDSQMPELEGEVSYVDEGSVLFSTSGNGWVYTFHLPESEEEYVWTLPGGKFNCLDLVITMDGEAVRDDSLLQPQIISELITE